MWHFVQKQQTGGEMQQWKADKVLGTSLRLVTTIRFRQEPVPACHPHRRADPRPCGSEVCWAQGPAGARESQDVQLGTALPTKAFVGLIRKKHFVRRFGTKNGFTLDTEVTSSLFHFQVTFSHINLTLRHLPKLQQEPCLGSSGDPCLG